jgi:hypothetical protein
MHAACLKLACQKSVFEGQDFAKLTAAPQAQKASIVSVSGALPPIYFEQSS